MATDAKEKFNYQSVIPWHVIKSHLEGLTKKNHKRWLRSRDHDEQMRIQGEGILVDKLMNLPETLTFIEQENLKEAQDAGTHEEGKS